MTVTKNCKSCKLDFITSSTYTAAWQDLCDKCYSEKRHSASMTRLNRSSQNSILALEKRIQEMEDKFSNIELVVEVSAKDTIEPVIQQYEGRLSEIRETVEEALKDDMTQFVEEHVAKFQRQLVKLNSRIRELEKDD